MGLVFSVESGSAEVGPVAADDFLDGVMAYDEALARSAKTSPEDCPVESTLARLDFFAAIGANEWDSGVVGDATGLLFDAAISGAAATPELE